MKISGIQERLSAAGVVPVLAIDSIESAAPLADALSRGGLPVAEITFRTTAAAGIIKLLRRSYRNLLVGAGTLLSAHQVRQAVDAGAQFGVAPGTNPRVVEEAKRLGLPFAPGVMTPSDIEAAVELGATMMKFFRAGAAGGPGMLKSLAAPYTHLGLRFMPTGGVSPENLRQYLSMNFVVAAGGTWIATREDVAAGAWDVIRSRCIAASAIVAETRGQTAAAIR
jgi:2-dehydro-3-deoxyphosphogluconate aldolase/(4S)-4-hydroxy-2-oxoglutarate aldolase